MSEAWGNSSGPYQDTSMSERVLNKIAEYVNRDTTELESPLYEHIDTDALDALFAHSGQQTVGVQFRYDHLWITIRSDAEVVVSDIDLE